MSEIKNEWRKVKLGNACRSIFSGGTPSTKVDEYWNGNINWLSSGETRNNYIINTEKKITEKAVKNSSTKLALKDNVIIASAGQGYTRGQVSYCLINTYINQSILCLESNKDILNSKFLYFNLKNRYNELRQLSDGHSSRGSLTTQILKDLEIKLPPLNIQGKIVKILSDIDGKIELNDKINDNLEKQAQLIFNNYFLEYDSYNILKSNKLIDLSKEIICGKTPSTKNKEFYGIDIPFITIPDMHNKIYVDNTERSLSLMGANSQNNKYLPIDTICVSCIGTAGLVSLTSKLSQTNQQINSIIPKEKELTYYIYFLMKNLKNKINFIGSSGSTFCNLNKKDFSNIEVPIPNNEILKQFHTIVLPMFKKIKENQFENKKLIKLKNYLLPKLMNGEINVENIEL